MVILYLTRNTTGDELAIQAALEKLGHHVVILHDDVVLPVKTDLDPN